MLVPIRCFSCGKPIAQNWEEYNEKAKDNNRKEVLDSLGMKRYCCRATFMGTVELDEAAKFKKF